jgi:hypothetical protein
MGLLTLLAKLPFLPVLQVIRLGEIIRDEAEREYHDPAQVRRELEEAHRMWVSGDISEDELSRIEYETTSRLIPGMPAGRRQAAGRQRERKTIASRR